MGGKGRKRREKNYLASHGGDKRLPPPPNPSSYVDVLPSKLRKIISFTTNSSEDTPHLKRKRDNNDSKDVKPSSGAKANGAKDERNKRLALPQAANDSKENMSSDANEEKKKKKRKRKQVNDLRFVEEIEKLGGVSTRKQRKKEYLKAKKKKNKKGSSEQMLDLPNRDEVKFGDVVEAPPNLAVIPKAPKKPMDASVERLRLQAIEAYRNRKGWTNRPGVRLPAINATADPLQI